MGMYDTICFSSDDALRCPEGHPLRDLQTKDLECELATYVVHGATSVPRRPDIRGDHASARGRQADSVDAADC